MTFCHRFETTEHHQIFFSKDRPVVEYRNLTPVMEACSKERCYVARVEELFFSLPCKIISNVFHCLSDRSFKENFRQWQWFYGQKPYFSKTTCRHNWCFAAMKRPASRAKQEETTVAPMKRPKAECQRLDSMPAARRALRLADVKRFYSLLNDREAIRKGRAAGQHGRRLYEGLGEFSEYLKCNKSTNVHRQDDATTKGLHSLCAAERRLQSCKPEDAELVRKQIVLTFAVWRLIGGTLSFAGEVGFLTDWGESEKSQIRNIISKAFEENRIPTLLSDAYSWPRKMREALTRSNATADSLEMVLHNRGKVTLKSFPSMVNGSLVGKFQVLDELWKIIPQVIEAAQPDRHGRTSMAKVGNVLKHLPFFGSGPERKREAGFFTKELIQDLIHTPIFPGGRAQVVDHNTFCPVGPGSLRGLELVFNRDEVLPSETLPMIQALHSFAGEFFKGNCQDLDLHDIQFQLCEYQKIFNPRAHRPLSVVPSDMGGPMQWSTGFVLERLRDMLVSNDGRPQCLQQDRASILDLAKRFCRRFGVSFRNESCALTHGDLVTIQEMSTGDFFFVGNGGSVRLADEEFASVFAVLTDSVHTGPIHFSDAIYLEMQSCRQLAWSPKKTFNAQPGVKRFDPSHQFTVQPEAQQALPRAVLLGEVVRLRHSADSADPVRLRRPKEVLEREECMVKLMQDAVTRWNASIRAPAPKEKRSAAWFRLRFLMFSFFFFLGDFWPWPKMVCRHWNHWNSLCVCWGDVKI